jgi:predicted RNA-binding Zn-ribbon protein involved in translation (DUF1610 family)
LIREGGQLKIATGPADTGAEADMNQDPNPESSRRIILPSGRALEALKSDLQRSANRRLHICPECGSELVQPLEWHETQSGLWGLTLECPNCSWVTAGLFSQRQVDEFEDELEDGLAGMLEDLTRLTQANMAEEVDRFATALRVDLILPEDF